jgi:hypothetical protein
VCSHINPHYVKLHHYTIIHGYGIRRTNEENPFSLKELKTIFEDKLSLFQDKLWYVFRNMFRRREACLEARYQHCRSLL